MEERRRLFIESASKLDYVCEPARTLEALKAAAAASLELAVLTSTLVQHAIEVGSDVEPIADLADDITRPFRMLATELDEYLEAQCNR